MGDEQMPASRIDPTFKPADGIPQRGARVIWVHPIPVGLGKWVLRRWPPSRRLQRWRGVLTVSAMLAMTLGAVAEVGRALFPSWVYFLAWMELWTAALSVAGSVALLAVWPTPQVRRRCRRPLRAMNGRPHSWRVLPPARDEESACGVRDGVAERWSPGLGGYEEE